jgi:hypothetical protein
MATSPQTRIGDALILLTRESYTIFAVGVVSRSGQLDFSQSEDVAHVTTIILAVQAAKALVHPQGRIYLLDIDTQEWSELPQ